MPWQTLNSGSLASEFEIVDPIDLTNPNDLEAMREMAVKAREQNDKLEARITALEARLRGADSELNH